LLQVIRGNQNEDGKVDLTSVDSRGTAKNCLTVGASENYRSEFVNETYGGYQWWPTNYPFPPIKDDPMTDGSGTDVVAFSSRGPTNDGRIKPDVAVPGTFILSTRSRFIAPNRTEWAKFAPNKDYFFMGGQVCYSACGRGHRFNKTISNNKKQDKETFCCSS
jgi:serine protease AprX